MQKIILLVLVSVLLSSFSFFLYSSSILQQQTQQHSPDYTPVSAGTLSATSTDPDTDTAFSTLRDLYTELVARFDAFTVQVPTPNSPETNPGSSPTPTPITDITSFPHRSHSSLTNLTNSDDHTQYLYGSGRTGGQTLVGGIDANDILTLQSSTATTGTSSTNKALKIVVGSGGETEALTILNNGNIGFQKTNPGFTLDVGGIVNATAIYTNGTPMVSSQWTTTGSNIFYTTGSVGIGTSTPTTALDIGGTLKTTGLIFPTGAVAGYVLTTDASGVASWTDVSSSAGPWSLTGNNLYPDSTSNNLAIGATDAGSAKLYVNGNVGVGTTAPTEPLHVTGNVRFGEKVRIVGAYPAIEFYNTSGANTGYIYYDSTYFNLVSSTNGVDRTMVNSNGLDILNSGNLRVGGVTTIDSSRRLLLPAGSLGAGTLSLQFSGDTNTGIYNTAADKLGLVAGGTESMTITNGNVGIGTTSPNTPFHIYGNVSSLPTFLTLENVSGSTSKWAFAPSGTDGTLGIVNRTGGGYAIALSLGSSNSTFSTHLLPATDNVNDLGTTLQRWRSIQVGTSNSSFAGNVGIGTTSPNTLLTIRRDGSDAILNIIGSDDPGYVSNPILRLVKTSGGKVQSGIGEITIGDNNAGMYFKYGPTTSASTKMTITGDGNIGVIGSISGGTSYSGSGNITSTAGVLTISGTGNSSIAGNVGIGTTAPGAKLDVGGGIVTSNVPALNVSQTWDAYNGQMHAAQISVNSLQTPHNTSTALIVYVGGSNKFAVSGVNGNVGINMGANVPGSALAIQGTSGTDGGITVANTGMSYGGTIFGTNSYPVNGGLVLKAFSNQGLALISGVDKGLVLMPGRNSVPTVGTFQVGSVHLLASGASTDILRWYDSNGTQLGGVTGSGSFGIGTTSPGAKLEVTGSFRVAYGGNQLDITSSGNQNNIFANAGDDLKLGQGGAAWIELDAGQSDVDIANSKNLDIESGNLKISNNTGDIFMTDSNGTLRSVIDWQGFNGGNGNRLLIGSTNLGYTFYSNSNAVVDITSTGNVGIGTTSPASLLDVHGTTWLRGTTGGTSGLYVNSSGNVGVGTTSPSSRLQLSSPTTSNIGLIVKTTDDNTTKKLTEWRSSTDAVLASMDATGKLFISGLKGVYTNEIIVDASGKGDYTSLQTALGTEGGGKKYIVKEGTYSITSNTNVPNNTLIEGSGWDKTTISVGGVGYLVFAASPSNIVFKNLKLTGSAMAFQGGTSGASNVYFQNTKLETGHYPNAGSTGYKFINVIADGNGAVWPGSTTEWISSEFTGGSDSSFSGRVYGSKFADGTYYGNASCFGCSWPNGGFIAGGWTLVDSYFGGTSHSGKSLQIHANLTYNFYNVRAVNGIYASTNWNGILNTYQGDLGDISSIGGGTINSAGTRIASLAGTYTYNPQSEPNKIITSINAATKGLVVRAADSQTANLFEWQNSAGTGLGAINASGNVGIGTTSPSLPLEIAGLSNGGISLGPTIKIGSSASFPFTSPMIYASSTNLYLNADSYTLSTALGTSRVTINSSGNISTVGTLAVSGAGNSSISGNLGIGTTSPATTLDLGGGTYYYNSTAGSQFGLSSTTKTIQVRNANTAALSLLTDSSTVGDIIGGLYFGGTNGATDAHITKAGIYSTLTTGGGANLRGANLAFTTKTSGGPVVNMILSDTGRLGIGTTSPNAKLDVIGSIVLPGSTGYSMVRPSVSSLITGEIHGYSVGGFADNGFLRLSAGGTSGTGKSYIDLSGNEVAGDLYRNIIIGTNNLERMRIDSAGNVGIGTTSPESALHVNGGIRFPVGSGITVGVTAGGAQYTPFLASALNDFRFYVPNFGGGAVRYYDAAYGGQIMTVHSYNGSGGGAVGIGYDNAGTAKLAVNGNVGIGTTSPGYKLEVNGTTKLYNTVFGTDSLYTYQKVNSGDFHQHFYTRTASGGGNTERLTIEGGADTANVYFMYSNVGIGTTSPGYTLDVKSTGTDIARFTGTNSTGCTLSDGGVIACSSDRTLKKNILETQLGLDAVMSLRPVEFNWNSQTEGEKKYLGFIAQEVEQVAPSLVTTDSNGYKQLNSIGLIPLVAKAIQEQQEILNQVQDDTTQQQGQLTMINDQLSMTNDELTTKVTAWDAILTPLQAIVQDIQNMFLSLQAQLGLVQTDVATTKDQVASLSASLNSMNVDYTSWKEALASGSGVLGASNSALLDKVATVSSLLVQNKTTTFDLTVLNKLTSGVLEIGAGIAGDEINSAGGIRFQTLSQGPIDFMNGKVVIDVDGSVQMTHLKLNTTDPNTTTIGTGTITVGSTSMIIHSPAVTNTSMIFITPTTLIDKPIIVNRKMSGEGFEVSIATPMPNAVEFQWMIVN